ncbi:MAG TPA: Holliday junction branch migration protein RuvA, partial [Solirubrobacteraceae bacterium]|nr:Holliday junction branch migration protein RuvA [Solirubrobacteraceae bacterium]
LFLMLIAVQSVGPKVALAVLSGGPPRELLKAVAAGDTGRLQAAPGVGKRTAERIIVELREKVGATAPIPASVAIGGAGAIDDPRVMARDGLIGLGYTPVEVDELLDGAEGERPEDLIAHALRMARR